MSNLEHLLENGLMRLSEDKLSYEEWIEETSKDFNWTPWVCINIDDLWEICQYIEYRYIPNLREEIDELREQVYGGRECLKQSE